MGEFDFYLESFSDNYELLTEGVNIKDKILEILRKIKEFIGKAINTVIAKFKSLFINDKNLIDKVDAVIKENKTFQYPIKVKFPVFESKIHITLRNPFNKDGLLNHEWFDKEGNLKITDEVIANYMFDRASNTAFDDWKKFVDQYMHVVVDDVKSSSDVIKIKNCFIRVQKEISGMNEIKKKFDTKLDEMQNTVQQYRKDAFLDYQANQNSDEKRQVYNISKAMYHVTNVYDKNVKEYIKGCITLFEESYKMVKAALVKCVAGAKFKNEGTVDRIVKVAMLETEMYFV